jgi:hypothetical protein
MKYFYSICVVALLFVAGCKDDYTAPCRDAAAIDSAVFSETHLDNIPYTGHDTLVYVSEVNDSIVLLTETYSDEPYRLVTDQPGNPECPNNDFITYDRVSTQLSNNAGNTKLFFTAARTNSNTSTNDSAMYAITGYGSLLLRLSALGARDSTFVDSVSLANHTYFNVNCFVNEQGDTFYVNGSLGLLQFKQNAKRYTLRKFNNK